jgi:hypothetical protein
VSPFSSPRAGSGGRPTIGQAEVGSSRREAPAITPLVQPTTARRRNPGHQPRRGGSAANSPDDQSMGADAWILRKYSMIMFSYPFAAYALARVFGATVRLIAEILGVIRT